MIITHEDFGKLYEEEFSLLTKISDLKKFCLAVYEVKAEDQELRMKNIRTKKLFSMMDDDKTLDDYDIQTILDSGDVVLECHDKSTGAGYNLDQ